MKKWRLLSLLFFVVYLFTGCATPSADSTNKIVSPKNSRSPIKGKWQVIDMTKEEEKKGEISADEWIGTIFQFSEEFILLGDYFLETPHYQIKRVNGKNYLLYHHNPLLENFSLPDDQIDVITVVDQDQFFCEMVWINDQELVLTISQYHFHLKKVSDEIHYDLAVQAKQQNSNFFTVEGQEGEVNLHSGIVVGLRAPLDGNVSIPEYSYRTVWVAAHNKNINPVVEVEGIMFPRRSGFWKMEITRHTLDQKTEDLFFAYNISTDKGEPVALFHFNDLDWLGKTGYLYKSIDYIGNDYVAIQEIGHGNYQYDNRTWHSNRLRLLPIDSLASKKNVKMVDLVGDNGLSSMNLSIQKTMDQLGIENSQLIDIREVADNFSLERKLGHWFFKGRINYKQGDELLFTDYTMNIIPPTTLVVYDELSIPWTAIKDRVPAAIDAYTSPNHDILVVITKSEMIVYGLYKGEIENVPLEKIPLKQDETVIMAEWALGNYVERWSEILINAKAGD